MKKSITIIIVLLATSVSAPAKMTDGATKHAPITGQVVLETTFRQVWEFQDGNTSLLVYPKIKIFGSKLIAQNKAYAEKYYQLGSAYCIRDRYEEAIYYLEKSIKLNKYNPWAVYKLAIAYAHQGNAKSAKIYFQRLLRMNWRFAPNLCWAFKADRILKQHIQEISGYFGLNLQPDKTHN